jgi:hypothetical protein
MSVEIPPRQLPLEASVDELGLSRREVCPSANDGRRLIVSEPPGVVSAVAEEWDWTLAGQLLVHQNAQPEDVGCKRGAGGRRNMLR